MTETFEQGLARIVADYATWIDWDAERQKAADVRKELEAIELAAKKFLDAVNHAGEQTRATLAAVIGESNVPGHSTIETSRLSCDAIRKAAAMACDRIPTRWSGAARPLIADKLRHLFEAHGKSFTAYASAYGDNSEAVECLLDIADRAGDPLTIEGARKLIEQAKNRET